MARRLSKANRAAIEAAFQADLASYTIAHDFHVDYSHIALLRRRWKATGSIDLLIKKLKGPVPRMTTEIKEVD